MKISKNSYCDVKKDPKSLMVSAFNYQCVQKQGRVNTMSQIAKCWMRDFNMNRLCTDKTAKSRQLLIK